MNKILIVDDSPLNLKILTDMLEGAYVTETAKDGFEAIEKAIKDPPSLVLLDVILPGMDGFEILTKLKEIPETRNIPVMFITGISDAKYEEKGLILGAVDYIQKPFNTSVVKARVNTHIQLSEYRKAIENLVLLDGLTGVYNRRAHDEFLDFEWRRAKREEAFISLALIDVDFFKKYNDNYGHLLGDHVLKSLASTAKGVLSRGGDYFARYGGEEFVFVMPATDFAGGHMVAEHMLDAINKLNIPHEYSDAASHITVSIGGVTAKPKPEDDILDFVVHADKMLYKSKREGRNRISWCEFGEEVWNI